MINKEDLYLFESLNTLRYKLLPARACLVDAIEILQRRHKACPDYHSENHNKLINDLHAAIKKLNDLISISETG